MVIEKKPVDAFPKTLTGLTKRVVGPIVRSILELHGFKALPRSWIRKGGQNSSYEEKIVLRIPHSLRFLSHILDA